MSDTDNDKSEEGSDQKPDSLVQHAPSVNPAHGKCVCECHRHDSSIVHCVPCCYPEDDNSDVEVVEPVGEKINITEESRNLTFASRIVLSGITHATNTNLIKKLAVANFEDKSLVICLTANGHELNFLQFAKTLEAHIDRNVADAAKELAHEIISGKFDEVAELADNLSARLKDEINARVDDWEDKV